MAQAVEGDSGNVDNSGVGEPSTEPQMAPLENKISFDSFVIIRHIILNTK